MGTGLLSLLAVILPTAIGATSAIWQGARARKAYKEGMSALGESKYDMRKSLQIRSNAYRELEKLIYGRNITPYRDYGAGGDVSYGTFQSTGNLPTIQHGIGVSSYDQLKSAGWSDANIRKYFKNKPGEKR